MSNGFRQLPVGTKFSVVADVTMIIAVIGLIFGAGRQSERLDQVVIKQDDQSTKTQTLSTQVTTVSGQMLQMTSSTNMAAAEARVAVLEARADSTDNLVRDFKGDMVDRLKRIEGKIDQSR